MVQLLLAATGMALSLRFALRPAPAALAAPTPAVPDGATARRLRQATVQIALYEFDRGQGIEAGGRGLGTLVEQNGERLIVTHDHWTHLNGNLREVEVRDAEGDLLLALPAGAFRDLIRYRDGGTLILAAPDDLAAVDAAPVGRAAGEGDAVWVARRALGEGDAVELVGAVVQGVVTAGSRPQLRLRGVGGAAVLPGDSGGGVWRDGRLVASVWSGGLESSSTWLGRLLGQSEQRTSNLIVAALIPRVPGVPDGHGAAGDGAPLKLSTPAAGKANLPE